MKIHDMEQYSDEWWALRALKLTASNAQAIGSNGKGLETYCTEVVTEYYSQAPKEQLDNIHIQRGNELEPIARTSYELQTGNEVIEIGMVTNANISKYVSASPDGEVTGKNKGIEIKCLMDRKHFEQIIAKEITVESKYMWQMQMQMLVTGWKSIDYVLFNPNFTESLLIKTVSPDEKKFEKLKEGIKIGEKRIINLMKKYEQR